METVVEAMCFEDEGREQEPRNAGSLESLEKKREQILPLEPLGGTSSTNTLISGCEIPISLLASETACEIIIQIPN